MTRTRHLVAHTHGEHAGAPSQIIAPALVSPIPTFPVACTEAATYDQGSSSTASMTELSGDLILHIGSYLESPEILAVSQTCKCLLTYRNQFLVGLLGRRHGIALDKAEPFLRAAQAVLSLTRFIQGSSVPCERASFVKVEPTHLLSAYR